MGKSFVASGNADGTATITLASYVAPGFSPVGGPSPVNYSSQGSTIAGYSQGKCYAGMTLANMIQQTNQVTGSTGQTASMAAGISINAATTYDGTGCYCSISGQGITSTPFQTTDTSHTTAVASGAAYGAVIYSVSGTATGIVVPSFAWEQDCPSQTYTTHSAWSGAGVVLNTSAEKFQPLSGQLSMGTTAGTETNVQASAPFALTLDRLNVWCSANSRTALVVKSRVNGADGNQAASVPTSAPYFAEDTSHTDAVAAGAPVNTAVANTGGSSATFYLINIRSASANPHQSLLNSGSAGTSTNGATSYWPFCGSVRCDAVLGETLLNPPFSGTLSQLNATLTANSSTLGAPNAVYGGVLKGTAGATPGNQTLSWTTSQTGVQVTDTSHTDAVVTGADQFTLVLNGSGASAFSVGTQSMTFTSPGGGGGGGELLLLGVG